MHARTHHETLCSGVLNGDAVWEMLGNTVLNLADSDQAYIYTMHSAFDILLAWRPVETRLRDAPEGN